MRLPVNTFASRPSSNRRCMKYPTTAANLMAVSASRIGTSTGVSAGMYEAANSITVITVRATPNMMYWRGVSPCCATAACCVW